MLGICCSARHGFHPFADVIHRHQYVLIVSLSGEWSHEINPSDINDFHLEVVLEGHCVSSIDVSVFLDTF
jgi:hypothetical protein